MQPLPPEEKVQVVLINAIDHYRPNCSYCLEQGKKEWQKAEWASSIRVQFLILSPSYIPCSAYSHLFHNHAIQNLLQKSSSF